MLALTGAAFLVGCGLFAAGCLLNAPGFGFDLAGVEELAGFLFGAAPEVTGVFFAPIGLFDVGGAVFVDVGGAIRAFLAGAPSIFFCGLLLAVVVSVLAAELELGGGR
jgi:hypothetical protein